MDKDTSALHEYLQALRKNGREFLNNFKNAFK